MAFVLKGRAGDEVLLRIEQDISEVELRQLIAEGITIRIRDLHRSHAHLAIKAPQAVSIDWSGEPEPPA
ncbi:hypothetical protein N878_03910 [Pseudomonas sp. EGD-AK9]|uniref:hypothetical protein n=1 Tax=Pseudomonas sp. EGD-AK9 TaxID=1386078 RepID=UPI0003979642|nr:hypothetical protein [Pseudomonas sp. EGD-AK9]ERI53378.1 hypothetical protein N878_03910 [Pseudomonas sp. EGD-AK9]